MASIDRRPNGQWRARWREYPGGPQKTKQFTRKGDAQDFLDEIAGAQRTGTYVDPAAGRETFAEWWERWRPGRLDLRASTAARDDSYYRNHIRDSIGPVPLAAIDRARLRVWVADMSEQGLAAKTVRHSVGLVRQALEAAVEDRLIGINPATRLRGLPKVEQTEMRIASAEDLATLAARIHKDWATWVLVAGYTGLRLGELSALRRGRVDLGRGRIQVVESVTEVRGHLVWGAPKTKAGRRSVPIPTPIVELLKHQCHGLEREDLVFTASQGGTIRRSTMRKRIWIPATVAAGLGELVEETDDAGEVIKTRYEGLRVHDLRHTAVSMWINEGANIKQLTTWAGHSSAATLIDRYGHLLPDNETGVMDSLSTTIAGAKARPVATVTQIA